PYVAAAEDTLLPASPGSFDLRASNANAPTSCRRLSDGSGYALSDRIQRTTDFGGRFRPGQADRMARVASAHGPCPGATRGSALRASRRPMVPSDRPAWTGRRRPFHGTSIARRQAHGT